jgi:3-oxoacyl-[acyl-carrier-protein] synthase II
MRRRRVKITGIGPVTPAGIGREAFWKGILEPVSRIRPFLKIGKEHGPFVAGFIDDFDIGSYVDRKRVPNGAARHSLFAAAASALALSDAGVTPAQFDAANGAIVTGSSLMDFGNICDSMDSVYKRGARGAHPRSVYTINVSGIQHTINRALDISSRSMTLQSACCSGMDAIGYAANLVGIGAAEIALCGGTEAPLYRAPMLELRAAGLTPATEELADKISRPFDLWRTTGVISEGACMLVIEPETSPRPGISYVSGYGFANDRDEKLCSGIKIAAELALAEANLRPQNIEAISAWGPGHRAIDQGEFDALAHIFGEQLYALPTVSLKGSIGMALGATPAIQVAAAALSQSSGLIPPTVNWEFLDPACPLNLSREVRAIEHSLTLVNSHGLGGLNACMVLEKC